MSRGFLIMAVREARRSRSALERGDTFQALNRLCWAWRYLGLADREARKLERATEGWRRAHGRSSAVVYRVMDDFVKVWPLREHTMVGSLAWRADRRA